MKEERQNYRKEKINIKTFVKGWKKEKELKRKIGSIK